MGKISIFVFSENYLVAESFVYQLSEKYKINEIKKTKNKIYSENKQASIVAKTNLPKIGEKYSNIFVDLDTKESTIYNIKNILGTNDIIYF